MAKKVSISLFKNSLAKHLGEVKAGNTLVITDRGVEVAVISPVVLSPEDVDLMELVLAGQVSLPAHELDESFFHQCPAGDPDGSLRRFLHEERQE